MAKKPDLGGGKNPAMVTLITDGSINSALQTIAQLLPEGCNH